MKDFSVVLSEEGQICILKRSNIVCVEWNEMKRPLAGQLLGLGQRQC